MMEKKFDMIVTFDSGRVLRHFGIALRMANILKHHYIDNNEDTLAEIATYYAGTHKRAEALCYYPPDEDEYETLRWLQDKFDYC